MMSEASFTDSVLIDGRKVEDLKVSDLKKELESRGLNRSGVKKDLVLRLSQSITSEETEGEPVVELHANEQITTDSHSLDKETDGKSIPSPGSHKKSLMTEKSIDEHSELSQVVNCSDVSKNTDDLTTFAVHETNADISLAPGSPPIISAAIQPLLESSNSLSNSNSLIRSVTQVEVEEEEDYEDEEAISMTSVSQTNTVSISSPTQRKSPEHVIVMNGDDKVKQTQDKSCKGPKETRGVGYLVEGPKRVDPFRPNKHAPSSLVYIRYLVRPFTMGQLKQMIETQIDAPVELWLDKIKSSAVVRTATNELAKRCRESLDGCRWPSINPRVLHCDFASEDLFAWLKENGNSGDRPPPKHLIMPNENLSENKHLRASENLPKDALSRKVLHQTDNIKEDPVAPLSTNAPDIPSDEQAAVKEGENNNESLKTYPEVKKDSKQEAPAKMLDDLFKKTVATPSIYWLPLEKEEAMAQLKVRIDRRTADAIRRDAASQRNRYDRTRGGERETRSPFAAPVEHYVADPHSEKSSKTTKRSEDDSKRGSSSTTPVVSTDLQQKNRKSSTTKSSSSRRSPLPVAAKRRHVSRSPSPRSPVRKERRREDDVKPRSRRSRSRSRHAVSSFRYEKRSPPRSRYSPITTGGGSPHTRSGRR